MSSDCRCQWKCDWNSAPLSVCTTWTRNGRRRSTSLTKRIAVPWFVDFQHPNARAVIDRGELIQSLPCPRDPLEEFNVHLKPMPRLRLLVPLPALGVGTMLLTPGQPVHPVPRQDAVDGRHR